MLNSATHIASVVALAALSGFAQPMAHAQSQASAPYGAWVALGISGKEAVSSTKSVLELNTDGSVTGTGGCNRFHGSFEFTQDTIRFNGIAATKMACPPVVMDQESRLFAALEAAKSWKRDGSKLMLMDGAGTAVAHFIHKSQSTTLTIEMPGALKIDRQKLSYNCGGDIVDVEYINTGTTSLATLSLKDEFVVAANVLAASGARYAGERLIWWTKGDNAELYDLMESEDTPAASCTVTEAANATKQ